MAASSTTRREVQRGGYQHITPEWVALWQVMGDNNAWIDYSTDYVILFEHAYQHQQGTVTAKPGLSVTYTYDTKEMVQTNLETMGQRCMRRVVMNVTERQEEDERLLKIEQHNQTNWNGAECNRRRGRTSRSASRARSQSRTAGSTDWS